MRLFFTLAASALAVAAAGAAYFRTRRNRLAHHILPRFFLLKAFYERLPESTSIYAAEEEWERFSGKILECLMKIRDAIGISLHDDDDDQVEEPQQPEQQIESGSSESQELQQQQPAIDRNVVKRSVHRVSDVVDSSLVPYLQSQKEVAMLLKDYLPKSNQSWQAFVDAELDDSEKDFFGLNRADAANTDDELEAQLQVCGSLVVQFISEIQKVSKAIEGATRGWLDDPHAPRKQHPERYTKVKVFYATDRKVTEDAEYVGERSADREVREGSGLHYGLTVVGIPDEHETGYVEAPTRHNEEADPLKHVVILSIDTTLRGDTQGFIQKINEELINNKAKSAIRRDVLLYIHGYNVHHKDAIKRAAQLKYDLKLEGVVIVYSWSSKGTLWGYPHDQETVKATANCLKGFIMTILSDVSWGAKVHILAHSMGNRALIEVLCGLQQGSDGSDAHRQQMRTLKNIIFAAADEKRTKFEGMVKSLCTGTEGAVDLPQITVYSSICDIALHSSKLIHFKERLGDTRCLFKMPYIGDHSTMNPLDVIDASGVDVSKLHHSYYGDVPDVIKDIRNTLCPFPARARARRSDAVIYPVNYKKKLFYAFKPSRLQKEFWSLTVLTPTKNVKRDVEKVT